MYMIRIRYLFFSLIVNYYLHIPSHKEENTQHMELDRQTDLLRTRYTAAVLEGDGNEAHRIVSDAMTRDIHLQAVYMKIFGPALAEVGRAWETGRINVAQEHLATGITMQQMARLREAWRTSRERGTGYSMVVAAVEGELHSVGASMIADLFHLDGWEVTNLGQDTPTGHLAEFVGDKKPELVILSLSHSDRIPAARQAAAALKALENAPAVFIGGAPIPEERQAGMFDADLVSSDPLRALAAARDLFNLRNQRMSLEGHLTALGQRVLELRRTRGWSQQELATRASLDRTYIGAVEKGTQNITIGAAYRIADALETSLSDLLG